mmetsp:Transcript_45821/g.146126  ORF Transcript_45821/g.146126 Transcript_45821/m.146126 type:complete len:226 (-) Transcript_45821:87-764(-)
MSVAAASPPLAASGRKLQATSARRSKVLRRPRSSTSTSTNNMLPRTPGNNSRLQFCQRLPPSPMQRRWQRRRRKQLSRPSPQLRQLRLLGPSLNRRPPTRRLLPSSSRQNRCCNSSRRNCNCTSRRRHGSRRTKLSRRGFRSNCRSRCSRCSRGSRRRSHRHSHPGSHRCSRRRSRRRSRSDSSTKSSRSSNCGSGSGHSSHSSRQHSRRHSSHGSRHSFRSHHK